MILNEIAQRYKEHLETETRFLPSSINTYTKCINLFVSEHETALDYIDSYNDFIYKHAIEKRSKVVYPCLRNFIKYFVEDKILKSKMLRNLYRPPEQQTRKIRKYLTIDERLKVIDHIESIKHRLIARIQLYTGARAREILTLKKGNKNISYERFDNKIILRILIVSKGGKEDYVFIHDEKLIHDIDDFTLFGEGLDYEYYFLDRTLSKDLLHSIELNYHNYWYDLKTACLKCGLRSSDWSTHDFRRAAAVDIWDETKDPLMVKRYLRHSRFDTTELYLSGAGLQNKDTAALLHDKYKSG